METLIKEKKFNEDGSVIYSCISRIYFKLKALTQYDNAMHIIDSFTGYKFQALTKNDNGSYPFIHLSFSQALTKNGNGGHGQVRGLPVGGG